jgi:bifunctional enzyme CysN/CysC
MSESNPVIDPVQSSERERRNGHSGRIVWLTGLSGAGKSTLAVALERRLFDEGRQVCVLDGDIVRAGLCEDLGFSAEDRTENIRRIGEVARLLAGAGLLALTVMPWSATSSARARVSCTTAPLLVAYGVRFARPTRPSVLARLMMML